MSAPPSVLSNEATLRVTDVMLLGPVLGRVVGMLAARANCPVDRLDDALLITDAVAAHAPDHSASGTVQVRVATGGDGLVLEVGDLGPDGPKAMLQAAVLPQVGNVFERIADEVQATDDGLRIVVRFEAAGA